MYTKTCLTKYPPLPDDAIFAIDAAGCVRAFEKKAKLLPEVVVIFRDGVGDGQIDEVLNIEVSAIRKGITEVTDEYAKTNGRK